MIYAEVIASMHSFVTMPQDSTSVAVSRTGTTVSNVGIISAKRTRMAMSSAWTYEIRGCNRALMMASNTIRFSSSDTNNKKPLSSFIRMTPERRDDATGVFRRDGKIEAIGRKAFGHDA